MTSIEQEMTIFVGQCQNLSFRRDPYSIMLLEANAWSQSSKRHILSTEKETTFGAERAKVL